LAEAVQKTDRILHVGYNRRFAPTNELLRKHIAQQEGPLTLSFVMRSIDIPKNNWYYWASNGNRVISNVCHLIDYALFWCNHCLPVELTTTTAGVGREDENVVVTIRFEDGSLANILYTNRGRVKSGYYQNYIIARGQLIAELRNFQKAVVRLNGKTVARTRGVTDMGHRAQMAAFAEALRSNGPPLVPVRDTLVSARTVLAAAEALKARRPIGLCFDDIPTRNALDLEGTNVTRAA
jgi:predicted dehydrogenase